MQDSLGLKFKNKIRYYYFSWLNKIQYNIKDLIKDSPSFKSLVSLREDFMVKFLNSKPFFKSIFFKHNIGYNQKIH